MPVTAPTSLLPLGLLAFGLLFVVLGVRNLTRDRRRRQTWQTYPGTVVASRLEGGQFHSQVAYTRHGRRVTFWNRYTASSLTDPVGREVEVLVNPEDPSDAVVSSGLTSGSTIGATLVLGGAVAAAIGVFLIS